MGNDVKECLQSGCPAAICGCLALIALIIGIVGTVQSNKFSDATVDKCMYRNSTFNTCTKKDTDDHVECTDGLQATHYYITQNYTCSSLYDTTGCNCEKKPAGAKYKSDGWVTCYIDGCEDSQDWTFTHPDTSHLMGVVAFIITVILIIITVGCVVYVKRIRKQAQEIYDANVQHIALNTWGHPCGGNGGKPFEPFCTNSSGYKKKITGVRLYGGQYLDSIQFQVNHYWAKKAGGNGGSGPNQLELEDGEYFNKIDIRTAAGQYNDDEYADYMIYIKFYTNRFRSVKAGGNGGHKNSIGNGGNHRLVDCKGRSGDLIDQLQFKWDTFDDNILSEAVEPSAPLYSEQDYKTWDVNNVYEWMIEVNNNQFVKYKNELLRNLKAENVNGERLATLNENDLHRIGVIGFKDKKELIQQIKQLCGGQSTSNQTETEAVTPYIEAPPAYNDVVNDEYALEGAEVP